jgi:hypothetical protein
MIEQIEPMEEPADGELMKDVNRRWLEKCNEMIDTFNSMIEKFEEWELEQERIQRLYG